VCVIVSVCVGKLRVSIKVCVCLSSGECVCVSVCVSACVLVSVCVGKLLRESLTRR